jgi:hypothetical protein
MNECAEDEARKALVSSPLCVLLFKYRIFKQKGAEGDHWRDVPSSHEVWALWAWGFAGLTQRRKGRKGTRSWGLWFLGSCAGDGDSGGAGTAARLAVGREVGGACE